MPSNPLDLKRKRLAALIIERRKAQMEAIQRYPDLDIRQTLERPNRRQVMKDLERMSEEHIDDLLEYHEPSGPQFVY